MGVFSILSFIGSTWVFFTGAGFLIGLAILSAILVGKSVLGTRIVWSREIVVALIGAALIWLAVGGVYRAGKAECETANRLAVEKIEAAWRALSATVVAANQQAVDQVEADRDQASADLEQLILAQRLRPGACILTEEDAANGNGRNGK